LQDIGCLADTACSDAEIVPSFEKLEGIYEDISSHQTSGIEGPDSPAYACNQLQSSYRGSWYKLTGVDSTISVSVIANYSTFLAVYTSPSGNCATLECVKQARSSNATSWTAQKGRSYWVLVAAQQKPTGAFILEMQTEVCIHVIDWKVFQYNI
jgi:hypothetical protein